MDEVWSSRSMKRSVMVRESWERWRGVASCQLGGEICHGDLAHHMAQPGSGFHARAGRCLLDVLMEFGCNVEGEVAHRAV